MNSTQQQQPPASSSSVFSESTVRLRVISFSKQQDEQSHSVSRNQEIRML